MVVPVFGQHAERIHMNRARRERHAGRISEIIPLRKAYLKQETHSYGREKHLDNRQKPTTTFVSWNWPNFTGITLKKTGMMCHYV